MIMCWKPFIKILTTLLSRQWRIKKITISRAMLSIIARDTKKYINTAMLAAHNVGGVKKAVDFLYNIYTVRGDRDCVITNGISCLRLYTPVTDIRKACLGTVDIEFAQCALEKLNIDPKIDELIFTRIKGHSSNTYRQFHIMHNYIENYTIALQYLLISCMYEKEKSPTYDDSSDVDEMIRYAEHNNLLSELYKFCLSHQFSNKKIAGLYAAMLTTKERHAEAALVYLYNEMWGEALDAFIECRNWKDALYAMDRLDLDDAGRKAHLYTLAQSIFVHGDGENAGFLYDMYLSEPELAVICFLKANLFLEAIHCASKYNRLDLVEANIKPEYIMYYTSLSEKIGALMETFRTYSRRLQQIRTTEIDFADGPLNEPTGDGCDCAESVAGSLRSATTAARTRTTQQSSRSRRAERKKQDLREGGMYENIALMRAIYNLINESYALRPAVKTLCTICMALEGNFPKAASLQSSLSKLLDSIEHESTAIWPPDLNSVNIPVNHKLIAFRKNIDELEIKYRSPPEITTMEWKLPMLDELS